MTEAQLLAPTGRRRARTTVVLPVVGLGAAAVCGVIVLAIGTVQTGLTAVLVGLAAALILLGPVLAAFLWVDRWEPEPNRFLVAAFAWGAGIAALTALLVNDTVRAVGDLILAGGRGDVFAAVLSAPVVEEAVKGLFVLALLLLRRNEFDGVIDGIVYAGITAAGFAFTENIFYFAMAFDAGGLGDASGGVMASFMLRGVLSPFVHPLFTALTGIGLGVAAGSKVVSVRIIAPLLGFLLAVGLHALWNSSAALGDGQAFLNFYFLVMVPIFAAVVWLVLWQRRREQRVIAKQLPALAKHGVIAASEVGLLSSLAGRRRWRAEVRRESGPRAAGAVRRYQAAVTELAFLRHTAQRNKANVTVKQRQRQLLAELVAERAAASGEQPAGRHAIAADRHASPDRR